MGWIIDTELIEEWLMGLDDSSYGQVVAAPELLGDRGPHLGRPVVDSIMGSEHSNMKELRPGSKGRTELRMLFAFDTRRRTIFLVAGDKSGDWAGWYKKNLPVADERLSRHLEHEGG